MDDLEQVGSRLGVYWAELMFSRLLMWGRHVPHEWPGTREEAERLVAGFVKASTDQEKRERLTSYVQSQAQTVWPNLADKRA